MNWGMLGTWIGVLLAALIGLYNLRANRAKTIAETEDTKADTAQKSRAAAAFDEDREVERERRWQEKLDATESKCNATVATMRAELNIVEAYVNRSIPWMWGAVREIKLHDIEYPDPPSIADVRREFHTITQPSFPTTNRDQ